MHSYCSLSLGQPNFSLGIELPPPPSETKNPQPLPSSNRPRLIFLRNSMHTDMQNNLNLSPRTQLHWMLQMFQSMHAILMSSSDETIVPLL